MKAIINGTRYDTEKADLIWEHSADVFRQDLDWFSESLYRTKRSKVFFLAGRGNARSRYAVHVGGGSYGPGQKITPMTQQNALRWAQDNMPADQIEAIFGDQIEDA